MVYRAFVDMSGGSSDDATLAAGYVDADGRAVIARVEYQGPPPPFDPRGAVAWFVTILREYGGDRYAGETFKADFEAQGIQYISAAQTKSGLYEGFEPVLNGRRVVLLDVSLVEQQLLGLVWCGGKIDHPAGEQDDWSNAVAGLIQLMTS